MIIPSRIRPYYFIAPPLYFLALAGFAGPKWFIMDLLHLDMEFTKLLLMVILPGLATLAVLLTLSVRAKESTTALLVLGSLFVLFWAALTTFGPLGLVLAIIFAVV